MNEQPAFMNDNGAIFYYFPGYWQMDYRDQDGSNDWYDGGCIPVDSADQYVEDFYS